jgi:predicted nucleic acid-binding protein
MLPVTFDTNVFIDYDLTELPKSGFFLSAVVVQELTAGARDDAAIRRLGEFRRRYEADGKLLVPTGEDWWHAGKILNAMHRGLKSHRAGRVSAIPKEEQQRILRDVLIARTAKRANVAIVTEDVSDFVRIQRYCDVRILRPEDYFPS